MREILFRGKVADEPDEWVYGYLLPDARIIQTVEFTENKCCGVGTFQIRPETVGQYTGMTDKNGKKMFEGDIIKDRFDDIGQIEYKPKYVAFIIQGWETGFAFWVKKDIEVIGNIHDNPELLK